MGESSSRTIGMLTLAHNTALLGLSTSLWAAAGAPVCKCGAASVRLPVGPRACSDAVYAGQRPVATLEDLPRELCSFFKQVLPSSLRRRGYVGPISSQNGPLGHWNHHSGRARPPIIAGYELNALLRRGSSPLDYSMPAYLQWQD